VTPSFTITETFTVSPTYTHSPTASPSPSITVTPTATPPPLCLHLPPSSPNPSNGNGSWLPFYICSAAEISVQVFTVAGELVRDIQVGHKNRGTHETFWDNRNSAGARVATGVYIYRVLAVGDDKRAFSNFRKTSIVR
jgi:hypothetical protein